MSIIVEDGAGQDNADAYVTAEEVVTYCTSMGDSITYADDNSANVTLMEAAIRKATRHIDITYADKFSGIKSMPGQSLEWPRSDAYDRNEYSIAGVPSCVKKATCELARRIYSGGDILPDIAETKSVKRKQVGSLSLEYFEVPYSSIKNSATPTYPVVDRLLAECFGVSGKGTVRIIRG